MRNLRNEMTLYHSLFVPTVPWGKLCIFSLVYGTEKVVPMTLVPPAQLALANKTSQSCWSNLRKDAGLWGEKKRCRKQMVVLSEANHQGLQYKSKTLMSWRFSSLNKRICLKRTDASNFAPKWERSYIIERLMKEVIFGLLSLIQKNSYPY